MAADRASPGRVRATRPWAWGLAWILAAGPLAGVAPGCTNFGGYAETARENYLLAENNFSRRQWSEAVRFADYVRVRFPYSRFAVEAELLIARAHFSGREYLSAQDSFKQFARMHPTHRHVVNGWVTYMTAVSAYMAGPLSTSILMPPNHQLDQSSFDDALVELKTFFDRYPESPVYADAIELEATIKRKLLEHELYVARFYLDRKNVEAAIRRLEAAAARFPGIGFDAEILFLLGVTYLRVDEVELSRETFSELQTLHPTHHHGRQARIYLRYIHDHFGPADPNRPRPERPRPLPIPPPRPKPGAPPGSRSAPAPAAAPT